MNVGTRASATDTLGNYLTATGGAGDWFRTQDHKKIGLMFGGWTMFACLLGGIFGVFPIIKSLGGVGLNPRFIFEVTTYHRLLLVFLFLVPAVPSTLGYFLLPLQLGARNMALPALSRLSLQSYVMGLILLVVSLAAGPIATGWTLASPLSLADPGLFSLVAAGLFCVAVSWFLTGVNFLVTVHHRRAPGMGFFGMPIMAWSMYLTAFILVAAGVLFAVLVAYLAASRLSGAGVFKTEPELWSRYFWFAMTPAALFSLLPAVGVVFEITAGISRRAVAGYRTVVGSMIALLGLSFITWGVSLANQGQDPTTTLVFSALSILTAVPVALLGYCLLATLHRGAIAGDGPDTFVLGFLLHGAVACLMGLFLVSPALGAYLGMTMFASAQLDYLIWGGVLFALLAGFHYWWPKMVGVEYEKPVARIGGILMIVGLNLALVPRMLMGAQGVAQEMISFVPGPTGLTEASALGWLFFCSGLVIVIGNLVIAIESGRQATANPWGAATLEWQTPSPPPVENFATVPEAGELYHY